MIAGFCQEHERGRIKPGVNLLHGLLYRRRRFVNPRMRDDRQEFVNTRPGNRPFDAAFRKALYYRGSRFVPFAVAAVRIYQDVGVDRDQPPRPV